MKLYTEEQVKESFYNGVKYASGIHLASIGWINQYVEGIINSLTPIELPSDDEMEKKAESFYPISKEYKAKYKIDYNDFNTCWQEGAKWMKEQIINK